EIVRNRLLLAIAIVSEPYKASRRMAAAYHRTNSLRNLIFFRRDCIHSPRRGVMLAERKKMKSRKQATNCSPGIRAGQILIFLAPLLVVTCLLILFSRPSNKREPNKVPAAAATLDGSLGLVLSPQ